MAYFDFLEDFEELLERRDIRCLGEVELKEDRDDESEFRWGSDIGNGRFDVDCVVQRWWRLGVVWWCDTGTQQITMAAKFNH
jgi:hypothetical protein